MKAMTLNYQSDEKTVSLILRKLVTEEVKFSYFFLSTSRPYYKRPETHDQLGDPSRRGSQSRLHAAIFGQSRLHVQFFFAITPSRPIFFAITPSRPIFRYHAITHFFLNNAFTPIFLQSRLRAIPWGSSTNAPTHSPKTNKNN